MNKDPDSFYDTVIEETDRKGNDICEILWSNPVEKLDNLISKKYDCPNELSDYCTKTNNWFAKNHIHTGWKWKKHKFWFWT